MTADAIEEKCRDWPTPAISPKRPRPVCVSLQAPWWVKVDGMIYASFRNEPSAKEAVRYWRRFASFRDRAIETQPNPALSRRVFN